MSNCAVHHKWLKIWEYFERHVRHENASQFVPQFPARYVFPQVRDSFHMRHTYLPLTFFFLLFLNLKKNSKTKYLMMWKELNTMQGSSYWRFQKLSLRSAFEHWQEPRNRFGYVEWAKCERGLTSYSCKCSAWTESVSAQCDDNLYRLTCLFVKCSSRTNVLDESSRFETHVYYMLIFCDRSFWGNS
jgi:hypothetical protein